jgi:hypothetical protein
MKIDLPLTAGFALQIASGTNRGASYPTGKIQKGLVLYYDGQDLSEEAVGFGVPILKRGLQTIFPGEVELYPHEGSSPRQVSARYKLNLEEKITRTGNGTIKNRLVYTSKNSLAAVIRRLPFMRGLLTRMSNLLRSTLAWETTYEPIGFFNYATLTYTIDAGAGRIKVELIGGDVMPGSISEIIVMNEQGARHFDQYQDSDGLSQLRNEIGCWDPVLAPEASFIDNFHQVSFSLPQVNGARLYRGRELVDNRLAWSGFGYSFSPALDHFSYEITVKRLP